jgi:hypothetical protein
VRKFILIGLALVVAGAFWAARGGQPDPILSIDGWWSLDYPQNICDAATKYLHEDRALVAQIGCEGVTSCPELTARANACGQPRADVLHFFDDLKARLASDARCHGLVVSEFDAPHSKNTEESSVTASTLIVDYFPGRCQTKFYTAFWRSEAR